MAKHTLGWAADEILTLDMTAIIPEDQRPKVEAALVQVVADGERTGIFGVHEPWNWSCATKMAAGSGQR